jgi:hypothetical protein
LLNFDEGLKIGITRCLSSSNWPKDAGEGIRDPNLSKKATNLVHAWEGNIYLKYPVHEPSIYNEAVKVSCTSFEEESSQNKGFASKRSWNLEYL